MATTQSSRRLLLAGAAVGATLVVVAGWRHYRRRQLQQPYQPQQVSERVVADHVTAAAEKPAAVEGSYDANEEVAKRLEEAGRCKERGNKRVAGQQYPQAIKDYTAAIELAGQDGSPKNLSIYYGNRAQVRSRTAHTVSTSQLQAAWPACPRLKFAWHGSLGSNQSLQTCGVFPHEMHARFTEPASASRPAVSLPPGGLRAGHRRLYNRSRFRPEVCQGDHPPCDGV